MKAASGTASPFGNGLRRAAAILETIRSHEWWEFKVPPLLATAYATALLLHVSFQQLWPLLLLVLFALLPGAAYVCVLNDITDLDDDLQCGKSNRMAGRSGWFRSFALAACIVPGLAAGWLLRHDPLTLPLYAGTWLAFTLYSVPPFRLKTRGIAGVAMDASGAHLLPTLWTSTLIAEATHHAVPIPFLCTLGIWAFALGLRGILWHQLYDRENDRRGRVATFAADKDPRSIRRFVRCVAFPLEVAALLLILIQVDTPWAWAMLALYLVGEWLNHRQINIDIILVQATPRYRIILAEYYQLQYPLTFLFAMAQQSFEAGWLIVLQLALFPHCLHVCVRHWNFIVREKMARAARSKVKSLLLRLRGSVS
jgi:4-hydroxybenzoate polyprenyltransferase